MTDSTQISYRERLLRVLLYIEEHLGEEISLDDLAEVAHFSQCHFHRIFSGMMRESLAGYIRRLRMQKAVLRLTYTDQSILDIALEVGYGSHEAFTRAFRGMYSTTPSEYRKQVKADRIPAPERRGFPWNGQEPNLGGMTMEVSVKTLPKMNVAFVRHIGPYEASDGAWMRLMGWAMQHGLFAPDTVCLGVCYDDPEATPADKIRYDACITVPEGVKPEGDVGIQQVGGQSYAMAVHRGPYENLSSTYSYICGQWAAPRGVEIGAAPSIEIYLNNPQSTLPEELITEVHVPLVGA